jgi:hypothetical protein
MVTYAVPLDADHINSAVCEAPQRSAAETAKTNNDDVFRHDLHSR